MLLGGRTRLRARVPDVKPNTLTPSDSSAAMVGKERRPNQEVDEGDAAPLNLGA